MPVSGHSARRSATNDDKSEFVAMNSTNMAMARITLACISCFGFTPGRSQPPDPFYVKVVSQFDLPTRGAGVAVAWSEDGSRVAVASDYGGVLSIWDRIGRLVNRIRRDGGGPTLGGSLAFVQTSSKLVFPPPGAANDSAAFSVWDVATGKIVATVNGPQPGDEYTFNRADHFMTSDDETILAMATRGGPTWKGFRENIAIYDIRSWKLLRTAAVPYSVSSLCLFARGRLIGLGTINSGRLLVLDTRSGATMSEIRAYEASKYGAVSLGAIAGSPSGDLILTGVSSGILYGGEYYNTPEQRAWDKAMFSSEAVRMFRVKDGTRIASFPYAHGPIRRAAWDPGGRYVAFVDNDRGLFLWAPWNGVGYRKIELPTSSLALAVSPDGDRIAVTTDSGVRVFSIAVGH
jgi:WD40 repeat protein